MNDQPIPINLTRAQWEHVLTMMAKQSFDQVAPLIGEIQRQCQMHEMRNRARSGLAAVSDDIMAASE